MFGHPHHPGFGPFRRRWDEQADWPFPGFGRRWGGFVPPRDRVFGRGDLKYVVLDLLKDQPRHGYDVIRALEERSRGFYRPSPGSVYPTLQLLEDLGYVTASEQEGKRVYTITDDGRRFLTEQQSALDDIHGRLRRDWAPERAEMRELMQELRELARSLLRLRHGSHGGPVDAERVRRLREIVARTRKDVEALFDERPESSSLI
jgi:DNA-binding PadR family transcriptional regulator